MLHACPNKMGEVETVQDMFHVEPNEELNARFNESWRYKSDFEHSVLSIVEDLLLDGRRISLDTLRGTDSKKGKHSVSLSAGFLVQLVLELTAWKQIHSAHWINDPRIAPLNNGI